MQPGDLNLDKGISSNPNTLALNMEYNFLSYRLKTDDTLTKIAIKFNCSISELKKINKISNDSQLFFREKMLVPFSKSSNFTEEFIIPDSTPELTPTDPHTQEKNCFVRVDSIIKKAIEAQSS
ncbi:hypothetical protein MXB_5544 [Myxobolus squamalis]|nr:hypothetical protein MXB_5544 [Myxobolus squamalis]